MSDPDPIVTFLTARLVDDQRIAEAATEGPWHVDDERYAESVNAADGVSVVAGGRWGGEASVFETTQDAIHIARFDPRRVLADVEAKRAILADYLSAKQAAENIRGIDWGSDETRGRIERATYSAREGALFLAVDNLVQSFADHPDFDPSWAS